MASLPIVPQTIRGADVVDRYVSPRLIDCIEEPRVRVSPAKGGFETNSYEEAECALVRVLTAQYLDRRPE